MSDPARLIQLIREAAPRASSAPADTDLLHKYATERDETAFTELVRRNGPLVLRTCRHVLGEAHADDAFQTVFLLLARSAGHLARAGSLAGWLHTAAVRISHRARRGEERRRKREMARRTPAGADDLTWKEVREVLDAEIATLPERYRLPLVLCYLQELTHGEAARQIGCPVGVLRGRLDRGRERLRRRLARYGLPLAAPVLAVGVTPPVSAALAARTVRAVMTSAGSVPSVLGGLACICVPWRMALFVPVIATLAFVLAAAGQPNNAPPASTPPVPKDPITVAREPTTDTLGDPLPPGAVARLGSARFHHGNNLSRVVVGADGKLVASESRDGPYKLWAGDTGRPVPLWDGLTKPERRPNRFTLTSAGGRLAAIVWDVNGSRLLDPVSGKTTRTLPPLNGIPVAELSPDGKVVAALRQEFIAGRVVSVFRIWSAETDRWTDLDETAGQPGRRAILFSADSTRVAYCTIDSAVQVWDVTSAKSVFQLPATASRSIEAVALSPDGKLLAREDQKATKVRIWDVDAGKERPELADQPEKLGQSLAFSPDGKTLAGIAHPITVRIWDVAAGKKLRDIRAHDYQVFHLAFTGDGKRLYAADGNGVSVWDPATGQPLDDVGGHRYTIADAAWAPDGKKLASGAAYTDNVARVWDPATGQKVFDLVGHKSGIERVAYSPDGALLATGSQDGTARLWDPATGKELHVFAAKDGMVYAMSFTPDGRFLVTGGRTALHVWDVAGRKEARSIPHTGGLVLQITFFGDGKRILVGDYQNGARVINFASGREEIRLDAKWLGTTAISPDDRCVTLIDQDGPVRLIDTGTGREVRVLAGPVPDRPDREAFGLAFSPDGRTVAVAYRFGEVRVYEMATGSERFRFVGHAGVSTGVRFSPDGSRLCSYAADHTLLIWDVTGTRLPPAPAPTSANAAWADLLTADAKKGFAAIRYLSADPPAALRFVTAGVKPVTPVAPKVVAGLIEKLGSAEFTEREAASKELAALAPAVSDQLRAAVGKSDSPEVRARLSAILSGVSETKLSGESLRATRAVEVLERIGTPDAQKVLAELAAGAPGSALTQNATAALGRLKLKK